MSDDMRPIAPKARSEASTAIPAAVGHRPLRSQYEQSLEQANEILAKGGTLKALSARQECFAIAVAEGSSASDAYRYAYGVKDVPWQVAQRANQVMHSVHVARRIYELKVQKEERLLRDRDKTQRYVIDNLQKIIELPGTHHSARVHALAMLGKLSGLFDGSENRANATDDKRNAAQIERELQEKLASFLGDKAKPINGLAIVEHETTQVIANNPCDSGADSPSENPQSQDDTGGGG